MIPCLVLAASALPGAEAGTGGSAPARPPAGDGKPRVVVSTDIGGGDPDDFQSMVHFLVYADRFDIEGLVSSPPLGGRAAHLLECLEAYERDFGNLRTWSADYPEPAALRGVVRQGAIDPQAGEAPGPVVSEGARLIIDRARSRDSRPLHVLVWGALTDVAQAVHADPGVKPAVRILSIGSWNTRNDRRARDYLFERHPDLWWIESDTTFRGIYLGGNQDGDLSNRSFPEAHVRGHGHLGALFMAKKPDIKMGDSPSVLYLLHGDPADPEGPHWGGSYVRSDPARRPTYWHDDPAEALSFAGKAGAVTVSRWREPYLRDWQGRIDRLAAPKP